MFGQNRPITLVSNLAARRRLEAISEWLLSEYLL